MKKNLLSFIIVISIAQNILAQCNPAIPSTANVVSSTQTVNGGFTAQWVCNGDTLISNGGIFVVYLEPGAVMNTGGGIDSIYVKNGATLNMNGGIHEIFNEPFAILNISGGSATINPCISITFDYTNAPSNGCLLTSAPEENAGMNSVTVFPNPTSGIFTIQSSEKISSIEIINLLGECIYKSLILTPKSLIDISSQPTGIYFLHLKTPDGFAVRKIVKQ